MSARNLLIIMSDEHQARAMGCASSDWLHTPNLDTLASTGVRFTNAYTPSPICVPARAAFATGDYVHRNRLWDNAMPYTGSIAGWGHALQAAGIPVESIGKLHYRSSEDPAGFDVEHIPMMVAGGVGMVWASIRGEDERVMLKSRMLGDYIGAGQSNYNDYDDAVVARAQQWIEQAAQRFDGGWCLYVGLVAPHFPLVVPAQYYELYPPGSLPAPKLHPSSGYVRHPWVEKQNAFMDSESKFTDEHERLRAISAYYGLCSYLDDNIGKILRALKHSGQSDSTTVIYTSDHGDNVGARGLWGKSNMYEESVAVPLILSGAGVSAGVCRTNVGLLDVAATIVEHFDTSIAGERPGESLYAIAAREDDPQRIQFSEYHAAGAVSGAFMVRKGRWKYIYYVGFAPELFDLETDAEETTSLALEPAYAGVIQQLHGELLGICDPQRIDALAHRDQQAMIAGYGGRDAALKLGAPAATPPPRC